MKKHLVLFISVLIINIPFATFAQIGNTTQSPSVNIQNLPVDDSGACITRPGKLQPLILTPDKNSAYYRFLQKKDKNWIQRIRDFFRNVYPLSDQES